MPQTLSRYRLSIASTYGTSPVVEGLKAAGVTNLSTLVKKFRERDMFVKIEFTATEEIVDRLADAGGYEGIEEI